MRPDSTSCRTAVAVKVFECEAIRKRWPVVSGTAADASATPTAAESTSSSPERIATWTPGTRRWAAWNSTQERRYGAAARIVSVVVTGARVGSPPGVGVLRLLLVR